jgi:predicted transcriptional regulator of viral defense system
MPNSPAQLVTTPTDRAIAALAARQHGVVTRAQLREIGLGDSAIGHRAGVGRLHRVHRGVYAVGHRLLPPRGAWMAATLACGPGAVLSHASAAALWEIRSSDAEIVHVTVPTAGGRRRPGLRVHRDAALAADEVTARDAIPVTTASRTLLDLAATLPPQRLRRALEQAEIERLLDCAALDALIARHAGHHRAAKLRHALAVHDPGTTLTRSTLEERFLTLCGTYGLPHPHVNRIIAGLQVDFVFGGARVVVETDGWRYHGTRAAFERDRHRDAILTRAGYRTLRFTHRQIEADARTVAATVAAALGPTAASRTAGTRSAR